MSIEGTGPIKATGPMEEGPGLPAPQRIDRLEQAFGPLFEDANPLGSPALLAADQRGEVLGAAERVLDDQGFSREFIPAELGGRLTRMDVLGRVLRPVFRRDAALGFGYGLVCFFAAVPVLIAGSDAQRRTVARLLRENRRLAIVRHEVAHGNAFVRDEFTATALPGPGDGFRLDGSKAVIANATRAGGLVVFARTEVEAPGRGHSVLLLDRAELPEDRVGVLARHATNGMRGVDFSGLELTACPAPARALVGELGAGYQLSLSSSLVVRGLIPSVVLACADTALRTVARFAVRPREDGHAPLEVQHVRSVLTGAFLDLLISDCLALVATRALHLMPRQMSVYAATAAYLAPKLVMDSMDEMSAVLGQAVFASDGKYGLFQKQQRDLPVVTLGHAGSASRQVSILPQLPYFARKAWFAQEEAPGSLFRLDEELPPMRLAAPAMLSDGDPLAATLVVRAEQLRARAEGTRAEGAKAARDAWEAGDAGDAAALAGTARLAAAFTDELAELQQVFAQIDVADRKALVSPRVLAMAERYTLVVAAAACLGVWHEQSGDLFLGNPDWVTAALYRLARRLSLPLPPRPAASEDRVLDEALARLHGHRSFDLYRSPLARDKSTHRFQGATHATPSE